MIREIRGQQFNNKLGDNGGTEITEPIRGIREIRGPQFGIFSADLNAC